MGRISFDVWHHTVLWLMYIMSMLSLFALRKKEPTLSRPFPAIGYPLFPGVALVIAVICLITMIYYNQLLAMLFAGLLGLGYLYFLTTHERRAASEDHVMRGPFETVADEIASIKV